MIELLLGPRAAADVRQAYEHYDTIEDGLGERFVRSLDELFSRLVVFPRSAPSVAGYEDVRRAVAREFPYVVFYRFRADRIDVLRVLHAARSDADPDAP